MSEQEAAFRRWWDNERDAELCIVSAAVGHDYAERVAFRAGWNAARLGQEVLGSRGVAALEAPR